MTDKPINDLEVLRALNAQAGQWSDTVSDWLDIGYPYEFVVSSETGEADLFIPDDEARFASSLKPVIVQELIDAGFITVVDTRSLVITQTLYHITDRAKRAVELVKQESARENIVQQIKELERKKAALERKLEDAR
jgi:hypothetical protein